MNQRMLGEKKENGKGRRGGQIYLEKQETEGNQLGKKEPMFALYCPPTFVMLDKSRNLYKHDKAYPCYGIDSCPHLEGNAITSVYNILCVLISLKQVPAQVLITNLLIKYTIASEYIESQNQ